MGENKSLTSYKGDLLLVKLAREIAIEMQPVDEILKRYDIPKPLWERLSNMPRFQELLKSEIEAWHSATNTVERVKIKAAAALEEWLPEGFAQMHDDDKSLLHRTEVAKLFAKLAGMDRPMGMEAVGEKFTVTINMGEGEKVEFKKDLPHRVIEGEASAQD